MVLKLRGFNKNASVARFGIHMPLSPQPPFPLHPLSGATQVPLFYDPVLDALRQCIVDIGYFGTKESFGLGDSYTSSTPSPSFPERKPVQIKYDFNHDRRAYSNVFSDLFRILEGDIRNESTVDYKGRPENQVRHTSSSGSVIPTNELELYPATGVSDEPFNGVNFSFIDYGLGDRRHFLVDSEDVTFETDFSEGEGALRWAHDLVVNLTNCESETSTPFLQSSLNPSSPPTPFFGVFGYDATLGYNIWGLRDFSYTLQRNAPLSMQYRLVNEKVFFNGPFAGYFYLVDCFVSLGFAYEYLNHSNYDPLNIPLYPLPFSRCVISRNIDYTMASAPFDGMESYGWSNFPPGHPYYLWAGRDYSISDAFETSNVVVTTRPTSDGTLYSSPLEQLAKPSGSNTFRGSNRLRDFDLTVAASLMDIRPSSFYAVHNAVSNYIEIMKTNYLETLAEIGDVLELAPDYAKLGRAAVSLYNGHYGKGLGDLGDFLSASYLQKKFGWDPLVASAREILDKAEHALERIRTLHAPQSLHGKFTYTFPEGTFGYKHVTLVTRAKVRIKFDESSWLLALMGPRVIGLLPSLSSLWDIVPMSFIYDWFTNLGNRLSAVDEAVSLLAFRVPMCVYSYTVYAHLDDELLSEFQLKAENPDVVEDRPQLKFYQREISHMKPTLGTSRFDFLAPDPRLDIGVVGSLLWQAFRKP